ncbi:MAG: DivIVA domain-containing protein, partial [Coriobacteriales bacterium]
MAITAKEIQEQGFEHSRKGYDVEEVDVFLEHVAEEVDSLNRQNSELRLSLSEAQEATQMVNPVDSNPALSVELAEAQSQIADLKKRLQARNADTEAISSAIIAAQKSADKIRQDARDDAKRIFDEAEAKARAVIRDALDRKKKTTDEIARLKDLRARFQTEYFAMIKKFQESGSEH